MITHTDKHKDTEMDRESENRGPSNLWHWWIGRESGLIVEHQNSSIPGIVIALLIANPRKVQPLRMSKFVSWISIKIYVAQTWPHLATPGHTYPPYRSYGELIWGIWPHISVNRDPFGHLLSRGFTLFVYPDTKKTSWNYSIELLCWALCL